MNIKNQTPMEIIKKSKAKAKDIASALSGGKLVIMPTETLYGAFVDATNPKAVQKLMKYKNRPFGKPYSVAVCDISMAENYAHLNKTAKKLYENFLPGPITVISTGKHKVAPGVESESGTLGIRIPDYPLIIKVIKKLGKPITATAANANYQKRPYTVKDITDSLSTKQGAVVDLIIDAGKLPRREPSTVIDTTLDDPVVLRQGDTKFKEKNKILSRSEEDTKKLANELWQKYKKYKNQRAIVFALEGPMGAGKTQFTKGLGKTLGIKEEVVSPSYTLEEEYKGKLVHIDAWRMNSSTELEQLDFEIRIKEKYVIAIEWAERVINVIRKYDDEAIVVWVKIEYGKRDNERVITWGSL